MGKVSINDLDDVNDYLNDITATTIYDSTSIQFNDIEMTFEELISFMDISMNQLFKNILASSQTDVTEFIIDPINYFPIPHTFFFDSIDDICDVDSYINKSFEDIRIVARGAKIKLIIGDDNSYTDDIEFIENRKLFLKSIKKKFKIT